MKKTIIPITAMLFLACEKSNFDPEKLHDFQVHTNVCHLDISIYQPPNVPNVPATFITRRRFDCDQEKFALLRLKAGNYKIVATTPDGKEISTDFEVKPRGYDSIYLDFF
ncbi:hypothetical protein [Olivibacter sitiensis]|uniref:hypothetical protein n=1 Tax=Olivibacter sitiensis TaxID=376470 RepID=UPI000484144C|nr:hypothetical protein [Olivibacter sitiensis]